MLFFRPVFSGRQAITEGSTSMHRPLGFEARLDTLKKEAKRWLKALRAGDAEARHRLDAVFPGATTQPALRDVQLALAREYGFAGWSALRTALDDLALARRSYAERVDIVVRSATWGGDRVGAARVLGRWPEIANADLYAAVVTGDLTAVERRLAADPRAAVRAGGPLSREPLLYLAYTRLPGSERHALALARLLLDNGADPNARFLDDWGNPFTVLVGAIGQGEGDQPPHPHADALARLLLERGADPFDTQVLYNTSITRDDTAWLETLWHEAERRGQLERWRVFEGSGGMGGALRRSALDYLLGNAVAYNHLARAEWLLRHGADPNGPHAYSTRSLRVEALVYGHAAMAELLERFGADATPLEGHAAFAAACLRLDREVARALVRRDPGYLQNAEPMRLAARGGRADVVALLLELGMDVDVTDDSGIRGLQDAIAGGSIEVVRLLVAHGAEIDRKSKEYGGGLGFAAHFERREIAELLAPLSRDVHNLTSLGMKERLHELFCAEPELVNCRRAQTASTPLFMLPDDEDGALDMTAFLLERGADPTMANAAGVSAIEAARARGLLDAAELMEEHLTVRADR
jgi:ankyrin repeat protein